MSLYTELELAALQREAEEKGIRVVIKRNSLGDVANFKLFRMTTNNFICSRSSIKATRKAVKMSARTLASKRNYHAQRKE